MRYANAHAVVVHRQTRKFRTRKCDSVPTNSEPESDAEAMCKYRLESKKKGFFVRGSPIQIAANGEPQTRELKTRSQVLFCFRRPARFSASQVLFCVPQSARSSVGAESPRRISRSKHVCNRRHRGVRWRPSMSDCVATMQAQRRCRPNDGAGQSHWRFLTVRPRLR
jgi:hypothetical protein